MRRLEPRDARNLLAMAFAIVTGITTGWIMVEIWELFR